MYFTDIKYRNRGKTTWPIVNFVVQILNFKYKLLGQRKYEMVLYCKKVYTSEKNIICSHGRNKTKQKKRPKLSDKLFL